MTDLPEPMVPAEVDLRDYRWMPFYGDAALSSDTWILATPEARCAAMTLWWQSWHQVPAGSLPANARLLASLAGYGVAVAAFEAIQEQATRGWVLCADGRLYHPFLAKLALDAWEEKKEFERRKAEDRQRKKDRRDGASGGNGKTSGGKPKNSGGNGGLSGGIPSENALTGQDRTGQENTNSIYDPVGVTATAVANNPDDLILAFDACLVSAWGEEARRWKPHSSDRRTAEQLAEAGITATFAAGVMRERFGKMRERGAKPPFSLEGVADDLRRSCVAGQSAAPAGQAASSATDQRDIWRRRLIGFRDQRGLWLASFGAKPGEPGCEAPADLVAEVLPSLAAPAAQILHYPPQQRAMQ